MLPLTITAEEAATTDGVEILIGVRAHRGAEISLKRWQPTADYLTASIPGYRFKLVPHEINSTLNQAVSRNEYHFVLTNPSAYMEMEKRYGTRRLVTLINKRQDKGYTKFGSVIFTRRNRDDIETLQDLKGKTFMAVDEKGFGGWLVAWRELLINDIDPYRDFATLSFAGGIQPKVVYAVANGEVDAGCVRTDMLERMAAAQKIRLADFKVLAQKNSKNFAFVHSTALYPEWPFAKLDHTGDELAERVASALLRIEPDHPAAISGEYIGWHTPLDYQPVKDLLKELHVGPYSHPEYFTLTELFSAYWHIVLATVVVMSFFLLILMRMQMLNRQLRITEQNLLASNQRLKGMAVVDGLTGVGNRRKLDEFLMHNWGRVCREGSPVCILLLDIDYFKNYNDTYGHLAGDECLKKIAEAISTLYRRTGELVVRYGGEEFLVMIVDCDAAVTLSQAEMLRQSIEDLKIEHISSKVSEVVTASIGMVSFTPDKNTSAEEYIELADEALYQAKSKGRNRLFELQV
jgi:diguanylate cyclase (GGDEF)-like protein